MTDHYKTVDDVPIHMNEIEDKGIGFPHAGVGFRNSISEIANQMNTLGVPSSALLQNRVPFHREKTPFVVSSQVGTGDLRQLVHHLLALPQRRQQHRRPS